MKRGGGFTWVTGEGQVSAKSVPEQRCLRRVEGKGSRRMVSGGNTKALPAAFAEFLKHVHPSETSSVVWECARARE